MTTITKTIGTSSRDYSTIAAWEADLSNASVYSNNDDAVGVCYNDSAFNEAVTINGGNSIGGSASQNLNSRKLTVHDDSKHDGTAGTGARNVYTGSSNPVLTIGINNTTVEWLEYDCSGAGAASRQIVVVSVDVITGIYINNMILHGVGNTTANTMGIGVSNGGGASNTRYLTNNIIYDISDASTNNYGLFCTSASGKSEVYNNTIHGTGTGTGDFGIWIANGNVIAKNNISMASGGKDIEEGGGPTEEYNMTSDATATGTGAQASKTTADQFVSVTAGSEDLHIKSGSDAIDNGVDLGTTGNSNIDINGRDRDAQGDTWDIGAHEFVADADTTGAAFMIFVDS
tara:strand:+ start:57 stop:1088 length:1032 start_codon:yes stop_codon:yes gene_type:complete